MTRSVNDEARDRLKQAGWADDDVERLIESGRWRCLTSAPMEQISGIT